jgi:hypothetical protein
MIFAGDVVIKLAIQQGLEDLRKNPWLLDDILGQFSSEPAMASVYGKKEIDAAKEWFLNNKIDIYMRYRLDKDQFPCITIALGSSSELDEMKHMADQSTEVVTLMPNDINKPISFVVKPFTPSSYDDDLGELVAPASVSLRQVRPGMILVDPDTGNGWVIRDVKNKIIEIDSGLGVSAKRFAVVPQYQIYKARREHSFFQESYSIGCHVHGDTAPLLWLHAIVVYSLLRYRESLLEARSFTQSSISSSDLVPNNDFGGPGGENVFSRYITLTGMVENTWLKTPTRVIEGIDIVEKQEGDVLKSGIKILSNLNSPEDLDTEDDSWTTIKE